MSYYSKFSNYEVQTSDGFVKWFTKRENAIEFYDSFGVDYEADAEPGDWIRLVNSKTKEVLLETVF